VQDAFGDGSLLLSSGTPPTPTLRGLVRPSRSLWRSRQDGTPPLLLAEFAGRETFYQETPTGGVDFRRPFFGHTSTSAAGRDRVFWAVTDTFEIRVHTLDGRPLAVFRKRHDYATITAADAEPLIAQRLEAVPDPNVQRQVRRMLGNLPAEGRAPAFGWPVWADALGPELQVDDDGNLWVVEYFLPRETRNARTVFSQDGVWLGSVVLPPAFAPAHIGSDFILGTWRDSLDVEQVQLYDLIKPGR
jgi:hypothetical protein